MARSVMCGVVLLVAATNLPAQPLRPLFTVDDYPRSAMKEGREGTVVFSALIGKDGRAKGCAVVQSSGSPDLDEVTCQLVMKRLRQKPVKDANGNPVEVEFTSKATWSLPR